MEKSKDPEQFFNLLKDKNSDVAAKYKAIFELKSLATEQAQNYLIQTFDALNDSELLKHEVCYALGQMKFNKTIEDFLVKIIENEAEKPVVRHEAGEALSNSGNAEMRKVLEKLRNSPIEEVGVTCGLAVRKLETYEALKSRYALLYSQTREPACPYNEEEMRAAVKFSASLTKENEKSFYDQCVAYICNDSVDIFDKYRTIYFLRNANNENSIQALGQVVDKSNRARTKVLLRHEVCFIFGQLESKSSLPTLENVINDLTEHEIVRHEAIAAYSTIARDKTLPNKYTTDPSRIVSESCLVALHMIDYWQTA